MLQARPFHLQAFHRGPGPHQHRGNKAKAPTGKPKVYSTMFLQFARVKLLWVMIRGLRNKRKGQEEKKMTFLPSLHSSMVSDCSGNILYLKLYRYNEFSLQRGRII